jgi:3-oxoacyl-(acyl-carrier-protein) synthase
MLLLERAAGESVDGARFAGGAEAATGREAIAAALRDAAIPPAAIGRAVLSAAGDPAREAVEREALRQALGRDVETFLPGALYGETQGACGVLQVACALLTHPPSPATPALLTLTSDPAGGAVALLLLPAPSPLW